MLLRFIITFNWNFLSPLSLLLLLSVVANTLYTLSNIIKEKIPRITIARLKNFS